MTISVVIPVYNQLALTRGCVQSLRPTRQAFELCVVDNASSDGTEAFFRASHLPWPLTYHRNPVNVGLIRALNQGAELASGDLLCFIHNDVETHDPAWLGRLQDAIESRPRVGLAGLYGARRVRRDGRLAGRTIVHGLVGPACPMRDDVLEVAAVDGVCLTLRRDVLREVGGFDEGYGFFHGYDRDLSFAVRETGRRCVVVNARFVHHGAGTRAGERPPVAAADDLAQRTAARLRFVTKWNRRLPCDVRTWRQRLADHLRLRAPTR